MRVLLIAALAAVGLLVSPWQRAIIFRRCIPAGGAVPRSGCPECGHQLLAGPRPELSVLRPSGRCPACRARSGPPPASVEVTSAVLLGLLAARIHPGVVLAADCFLAVCAVPLAYIDAAVRRLPNVLTGPAYAGTLLILALAAGLDGQWPALGRAVLGGVVIFAAYWVMAFISPSAVGGGDMRLAASIGTALAWYSWATLLGGVLAGFLLAAVYGIALLAARRASLKQQLPFGPFMIAGAFLVILAGSR